MRQQEGRECLLLQSSIEKVSMSYVPSFRCVYCGETKSSEVMTEQLGVFVPCDCLQARERREFEHRIDMERRKRHRRGKK
jgi:hypothetical protein